MRKFLEPQHFSILEQWVKTHLTDWGSVDDYCTHTMGFFLYKYPRFASKVKTWIESKNPWIRRAVAVTFIYGLRRGTFKDQALDVASALLSDEHKYVRWGYGWMLKEGSKHFLRDIYEFVMRNKAVMPRPALRYAIEKMPDKYKAKAME
jgi:3-methyladenine DNA glycosylase AlkD